MQLIDEKQWTTISGGNNSWAQNDDLLPTVVRNAGIGAMAGAIGGPGAALAGGVVGALVGFSVHSESGGGGGGGHRQCLVEPAEKKKN